MFRCNAGIVFDAAMLQQIGMNLSIDPASHDVSVCLDVPPRIRGDEERPEDREDDEASEATDTGLAKKVWSWVVSPFALLVGRSAAQGWISDSAQAPKQGRPVVPGRQRADRVSNKDGRHPHAVDVRKTVLFDPEYEAREERRDALSPLFDQLSTASGSSRFFVSVKPCRC